MKIDQLVISTVTTMQVKSTEGELLPVYITGATQDSSEWRKNHKEIFSTEKTTPMYVSKKGGNRIDIDNDPLGAYNKRIRLLASVVTEIDGLDNFDSSPESVLELFSNDGCAYIVDQWETHLEDREAAVKKPKPPAKPGPKS